MVRFASGLGVHIFIAQMRRKARNVATELRQEVTMTNADGSSLLRIASLAFCSIDDPKV